MKELLSKAQVLQTKYCDVCDIGVHTDCIDGALAVVSVECFSDTDRYEHVFTEDDADTHQHFWTQLVKFLHDAAQQRQKNA